MRVFLLFILATLLVSQTESVIRGLNTTIHRAPFLAYIYGIHRKDGYVSRTSGMLVHRRYVLLSARRCKDLKLLRVTMGSSTAAGKGGVEEGCKILQWWIHPKYGKASLFSYSFCMIKLVRNMQLSRTVQVATLATPGEHMHANGHYAVAAWGITKPSYDSADQPWSNNLHYIESQVTDWEKCKTYHKDWLNSDDLFCIGFATDDKPQKTGKGDEGAPFFSQHNGVVYAMVVNIMEEEPLEESNRPTLAAKVSEAFEWILQVVAWGTKPDDADMVNLCYGKDQEGS